MLYIFAVALVLIMIGELADKSQLLALLLACRYKAWQVLIGIFVSTFVIHFFTTLVGQFLGSAIPTGVIPWMTGILFIGFGVWTLRGDRVEQEEADRGGRFGPIVATAVAFFLAELGDKTQIMTMTIAADPAAVLRTFGAAGPAISGALGHVGLNADGLTATQSFWGVWMGSTVGMMIADGVAIVVGSILGKRLPERLITRISGALFILFGVATLWAAVAKAL